MAIGAILAAAGQALTGAQALQQAASNVAGNLSFSGLNLPSLGFGVNPDLAGLAAQLQAAANAANAQAAATAAGQAAASAPSSSTAAAGASLSNGSAGFLDTLAAGLGWSPTWLKVGVYGGGGLLLIVGGWLLFRPKKAK